MFSGGCREQETFETLRREVAHPSAITQDGTYFYVVNSDLERRYNKGSILTIDTQGKKKGVILTPRLGRFITHRGGVLIAGHSTTEQYKRPPLLRFYDATQPEKLRLIHSKQLPCSPINAYAPEEYPYFAVSCMNGIIYIGEWPKNPTSGVPKLHKVRDYGPHARRALYIDTETGTLFAFTTDWQRAQFSDEVMNDGYDYSTSQQIAHGNDIPDIWERPDDGEGRRLTPEEQHTLTSEYRVAVYSIAKEKDKKFPYASRLSSTTRDELLWLHFSAGTSGGGPSLRGTEKFYRSNFWHASSDPGDPRSFIVSQRGLPGENTNRHTNALYRFTINHPPINDIDERRIWSEFMSVELYWGHAASDTLAGSHLATNLTASDESRLTNEEIRFTGNFEIAQAHKSSYVVVNDFRDTSLFPDAYYALSLRRIHGSPGFDNYTLLSRHRSRSYFALSAIKDRVLAGSFYTNTVSLFSISDDFKLKLSRTID